MTVSFTFKMHLTHVPHSTLPRILREYLELDRRGMTVYSFMKELLVEEGHFGNRNGAGGKTALQSSISNP